MSLFSKGLNWKFHLFIKKWIRTTTNFSNSDSKVWIFPLNDRNSLPIFYNLCIRKFWLFTHSLLNSTGFRFFPRVIDSSDSQTSYNFFPCFLRDLLSSFSPVCPEVSWCAFAVIRLLLGETETSVGPPESMFWEILTSSVFQSLIFMVRT